MFQQFNLFPALTVFENVEYALNLKGVSGKAAKEQAKALVDALELSERGNYLPRDLSGGQKQRVAIARAMAAGHAAILADEPTANLDSQGAKDAAQARSARRAGDRAREDVYGVVHKAVHETLNEAKLALLARQPAEIHE